jgi:hypothetical protein
MSPTSSLPPWALSAGCTFISRHFPPVSDRVLNVLI